MIDLDIMKLQLTLTTLFTALYFNNVYAVSDDAYACNKAYEQGDYDKAARLAAKALNINNRDRDALMCQGRTHSAQGDLQSALTAFKSAEKLSESAFDKAVVALVTGHAYKNAAQYEQALSSYQQSLIQGQSAKSKGFERVSLVGIGNVHFKTQQFTQALDAYLSAAKLDANDNERGETFEKIAETYHAMNQHDLALEYQIKAYFMHQKVGTPDQYAHSSIELGRYYAAAKNFSSAENTLNKIIKFANEQGGAYYEAQGCYVLAQVKAAAGDMQAARDLIAKARLIAKNTNDAELDEEITKETQSLIQ